LGPSCGNFGHRGDASAPSWATAQYMRTGQGLSHQNRDVEGLAERRDGLPTPWPFWRGEEWQTHADRAASNYALQLLSCYPSTPKPIKKGHLETTGGNELELLSRCRPG
jgi:hypothetical protein